MRDSSGAGAPREPPIGGLEIARSIKQLKATSEIGAVRDMPMALNMLTA